MNVLPDQFSRLEPWLDSWLLPDSAARLERRLNTPYEEIKDFYDAMLPHAPAALAYLAERELGALEPHDERLLKLMLSLAEIGPAVEWYEQPAVIDGFGAERFSLIEQLSDTDAQEG